MALRRIRLELARTAQFPEGSAQRGYEFVAPLSDDGQLDEAEWRTQRDACTVHRFWAGEYVSLTEHDGCNGRFGWSRRFRICDGARQAQPLLAPTRGG